ncbi:MAG: hypothetical protein AB7S51_01785 [Porticoccaceae bacterium]
MPGFNFLLGNERFREAIETALDPGNPVFVSSPRRCVGLIRKAAREVRPVGAD